MRGRKQVFKKRILALLAMFSFIVSFMSPVNIIAAANFQLVITYDDQVQIPNGCYVSYSLDGTNYTEVTAQGLDISGVNADNVSLKFTIAEGYKLDYADIRVDGQPVDAFNAANIVNNSVFNIAVGDSVPRVDVTNIRFLEDIKNLDIQYRSTGNGKIQYSTDNTNWTDVTGNSQINITTFTALYVKAVPDDGYSIEEHTEIRAGQTSVASGNQLAQSINLTDYLGGNILIQNVEFISSGSGGGGNNGGNNDGVNFDTDAKIEFRNINQIAFANGVATFTIQDENIGDVEVTVTPVGTATLKKAIIQKYNPETESNYDKDVLVTNGGTVNIAFSKNPGNVSYKVFLNGHQQGNDTQLEINNKATTLVTTVGYEYEVSFDDGGNNGGGGGSEAIINLSGPDGSWLVDPMVREDYDVVTDEYSSAPYSNYAFVTQVSINEGGGRTDFLAQYNKGENYDKYRSQTIRYAKQKDDDGNDKDTVDINLSTNWGNRIESVTINDVPYDIPFDYDNRNAWLNHMENQNIGFTIKNVPINVNAEEKEEYNIKVQVRPITEAECFIGNFLWSNDDRMDPEVTGEYNDLYIGHSNLELVSVTYNDGTGWKTKNKSELFDENGNVKDWYVQQLEQQSYETGIWMSEMVVPEGSWVTMKIEAKRGYQVKSFNLSGEDIRVGDTSVFSFRIGKGNFHIGAHVEKQEDEVKVKTNVVSGGTVELAEGTIDAGSARLQVADPVLSEEKEAEFAAQAAQAGYSIDSCLSIGLEQVFYKGTGNSNDVWANKIEEMDDEATISLQLAEGLSVDNIAIIHNIHNGEKYEVIKVESYDPVTRIVTFKVKSFSNFAIAVKEDDSIVVPKTDSAEDIAAAKAVNDIIDDIINGKKPVGMSEELIAKLEKAVNDGKKIEISVSKTKVDEKTVAEDMKIVNAALKTGEKVAAIYDIDINVIVDNQIIGTITELKKPISIEVELVDELVKVPEGYSRTYGCSGVHGGKLVSPTIKLNGKKATLDLYLFSTYAVTYKDTATTVVNKAPKTGDDIMLVVMFLAMSALGLGVMTRMGLKKKQK